MYSEKAMIISSIGLYGRSATSFIQLANRFKSTVFVEYEEKKANAKSLLGVLSLALTNGCEVTITADGVDETEAVKTLVDFMKSGCPADLEHYEELSSDGFSFDSIDSQKISSEEPISSNVDNDKLDSVE